MSNINQILNSALLESVDDPFTPHNKVSAQKKHDNERADAFPKVDLFNIENAGAKPDWSTKISNVLHSPAGKYSAATLAALGAGIGAVALAKKLRAKKAAVKEAPKK